MTQTRGFTLVELVVVITLTAVIASFVGSNISRPIESFFDTTRRAHLVDTVELALSRMTREIRLALPNSIRVSGTAIEFLRTLNGGRYRGQTDMLGAGDILDFTLSANTFDVLGPLDNFGVVAVGAADETDCIDGDSDCLVIFNTGQPAVCGGASGANAYCADNLAGIVAASATAIEFSRAASGTAFPYASPDQRFHIVDTPVSFVCDPVAREIQRFVDYDISAAQAVPPVGATAALVVDKVTACSFSYDPGTATRAGLVSISIAISDVNVSQGGTETVTLMQQVHVPNLP